MERLTAYSKPGPNDSTVVDVEGMAVDLITVMKAGGITQAKFIDLMITTWEDVHVTIDTTNVKKDS